MVVFVIYLGAIMVYGHAYLELTVDMGWMFFGCYNLVEKISRNVDTITGLIRTTLV